MSFRFFEIASGIKQSSAPAACLLAFAALLFQACSNDQAPETHAAALASAAAVEAAQEGTADYQSSADNDIAKYNAKLGIADLSAKIEAAKSAKSADEKIKILKNIAPVLLDPALIQPKVAFNESVFRAFYDFNALLLGTYAYASAKEASQAILVSNYEPLLFAGCDANLHGCLNLDFFGKVGNSKDIVLAAIASHAPQGCEGINDGVFYRRLKIGYALTNWGVDEPRLDALFLDCSIEYLKSLDSAVSTPKQRAEIDRFLTDVERILARSDRLTKTPALRASLDSFKRKLDPNAFVSAITSSSPVDSAIYRIRKSFLISDLGAINDPKFAADIHQSNIARGDSFTYDKILKLFAEEKSPILKNLGVAEIQERGALFTIVESVATRRWTPNMGLAYFESLKKENPEQLKAAFEALLKSYAQAMFLKQVVESNGEMGKFYAKTDFQTAEMIQEALDKSQSLQKDWGEFYARIELLRELAAGALRLPANKLSQMGLDNKSLVLSSYYMISFPHMIMMAYYMAEKKFEVTIHGFFGQTFKINYVDILEWIFEGGMAPWFSYAPGNEMGYDSVFNSYQVLHSLYFAFRTETFKVFKVKEEEFLKKAIDTMVYNHLVLYSDGYDVRALSKVRYGSEYEKIKLACVEERKREQARKNGQKYIPNYQTSFDFAKLDEGILYNEPWYQILVGKQYDHDYRSSALVQSDMVGFDYANYVAPERLDIMRLGTARIVRNIESILQIYREFLRQKGVPADEIAQKIDYVSTGLVKLRHQQRRYYTALDEMNTEVVKDCAIRLGLRENELYNELHWKEIEHLRSVYRDKVKVLNNEAKYADLIGKYRFSGYESIQYTGRDDFSGKVYHYTATDAHMRIPRFLADIAPYIHVEMPSSEAMRKTEVFTNTAHFTDVPFFDAQGQLVSEDTFVRTALSFGGEILARSKRAFFHWEVNMVLNTLWDFNEYYLPAIISMMRLGEVETYDSKNPLCLGLDAQPESICPVKKKRLFTGEEVIQENMALAKWISLKPEEEQLYDLENMPAKVLVDFTLGTIGGSGHNTFDPATAGTIFDPITAGSTGFFDYSFLLVTAPLMGQSLKLPWSFEEDGKSGYDPHRFENKVLLTDYYKSQVWLQFIPFSVDTATNNSLHAIYRGFYREDNSYAREMLDQINRVKAEDEKNNYKRRLRRSLWDEPYFGPYLTNKYLNDYEQGIKDFDRETMGFYNQNPAVGQQ